MIFLQVLSLYQINLDDSFSHFVWNWEGICPPWGSKHHKYFLLSFSHKIVPTFHCGVVFGPVFQRTSNSFRQKTTLWVATMFIILQSFYQIKMVLTEMRMCYANHKEACKYYLASSVFLFKDNSYLKVESQPSATRLHKWIYRPRRWRPKARQKWSSRIKSHLVNDD